MIDANAAFAYGQVYVALSRCRTFEGIVLRTPIPVSGIKTDTMVQHFATEARKNEPDSDKLHESKFLFQKELIFELFDFKTIRSRLEHLIRQMKEHSNTLDTVLINDLDSRRNQFETELFQVLEKFRAQMNYLMATTQLPEENQTLQERITKGAAYISEKTSAILQDHIFKLRIDTDNQAVKKQLTELLEKLQKELFIRQAGLKACLKGFETIAYLKARSNAELDFRPPAIAKSKAEKAATGDFPHPELYAELTSWRDMYAEEYDLPQYMILPQKSIRELLQRLPVTIRELNAVKGLGPAKIRQFGAEIISIIRTYCEDHQISAAQPELPEKKKKTQGDSMQISYNLFMAGSSIGEIAKKRGLAVSTIESHLTHFATTGVLPVTKLISEEKLKMMSRVISEHPEATLSDLKNMLGETASYFEIRLARGMGNW
jgi:ribonuclease D